MKAMVDAAMTNGSADGTNLTAQAQAGVDAAVAEAEVASMLTLTSGNDNLTGMLFEAPQTYTPGGTDRINSLQDNDKLTGTSTMDVLNVTIGRNADTSDVNITPVLTGVDTVNVKFDETGYNLDMQDSTGATSVNILRMDLGASNGVLNMKEVAANLSLSNSAARAATATFDFLDSATVGTIDTTTLTLNSANAASLVVQSNTGTSGIETINMVSSTGANSLGLFTAQDLKTLNISGEKNLTIGSTGTATNAGITEAKTYVSGLANVDGSLNKIDASTLKGNLDITFGSTFNAGVDGTSGTNTALSVLGGTGDDTFRLMDAVFGTTDKIDGGTGANTVQIVGSTTIAAGTTASVTKVQALSITTGHDLLAVADTVTVDADAFDALASVYVRNEGQNAGASASEVMTVNLTDLTSAQANAITLAHGTTGNSTIANNIVNVALKTATATTDSASFTLVDGINADTVFNARLAATAIEKVTIADNDTESNTIHLTSGVTAAIAGSSTTLTGGVAGKYMNLDSTTVAIFTADVANNATLDAAILAGVGVPAAATAVANDLGYGQAKNGGAQTATTAAALETAPVGFTTTNGQRDMAVSTVFNGNGADDSLNKIYTETIDASTYVGDVIVRLDDITRADGVTSQSITTSTGNDTFIFDNISAANAGFTSADTIAASTGTDTLILDGDTSAVPGTPVITHAASEWDKLTGIDVMRFGSNTAGYSVELDNELIDQTDSTSRLTIVNNDGRLDTGNESTLTVNARALNQSNFITFVGANSAGLGKTGVNTIQLSDVSANGSQILNGGDTDVRVSTTVGYAAGNNNVYNVWNSANVSINDLAQVSNFGAILFNNDQAVAQTLTLTLNNTVVEAMVDSSNTATTAATQEHLAITAVDGAAMSILNVDASQVSGYHAISATGSASGNDIVTVNTNVGGTGSTIALGAGTDRLNYVGTATGDGVVGGAVGVTINLTAGTHTFVSGASTTNHTVAANSIETLDISGITTYDDSTITAGTGTTSVITGAGADTVTASTVATTIITTGAGNDTINSGGIAMSVTGGTGNDTITGGAGVDTIIFSGVSVATNGTDTVGTFTTTADKLQFSVADVNAAVLAATGVSPALVAGALAAGNYTAGAGLTTSATAGAYFVVDTATKIVYFDADSNGAGVAVALATITGVTAAVGDFVLA